MIRPGLVSVSFRQLAPPEIVERAAANGLHAIEWGGDVHVPPDDPANAARVRSITEAAGLAVAAYGSYYRVGEDGQDFPAVLESAAALGAPLIRVWAGLKPSAEADDRGFARVTEDLHRVGTLAGCSGIGLTIEFHPNTLADGGASTLRLLKEVNLSNVGVNWQPDPSHSAEERSRSLRTVLPHLTNLHVFNWSRREAGVCRLPLAEAEAEWLGYVAEAVGDRYALLEFMPHDLPEELPGESGTLLRLLQPAPNAPRT